MGINKLIAVAAILAVLGVSSGKLPQILHSVRVAQFYLIQDSQASRWGQAMVLPVSR